MANQVFDTYSFLATGGTTARTQPNREADVFNVKDYGAVGDNSTNDRAAIQAAINAAITNNGGTVFFPSGSYFINASITVAAGNNLGIRLKGCGSAGSGSTIFAWGTRITGNFQDYLIRTLHVGGGVSPGDESPIGTIEDIGFNNAFDLGAAITSTQSPNDAVTTGNGHGCVYMTTEAKFVINNCSFTFVTGIGLFCTAQTVEIVNCSFQGAFAFTHADRSIGVFINNGVIRGGAITACGIAAMQAVTGAGFFGIENIDCEGNGSICVLGYSTIAYWAIDSSVVTAAGRSNCNGGFIRKLQGESNGCTDSVGLNSLIYLGNVGLLAIESVKFANISVRSAYGLFIDLADKCLFQSMDIDGSTNAFDTAAVHVGGATGCRFSDVSAVAGAGATGVNWDSPIYSAFFDPGSDGCSFDYCNTDGAVAMNPGGGQSVKFPSLPSSKGQLQWVSDCIYPTWTGTVSNVGRQVAAGLTMVTSGSSGTTKLQFAVVPTFVSTGWVVICPSQTAIPGGTVVNTIIGTTAITLSSTIGSPGIANGSFIAIIPSSGTNTTLLRWTGDYTSSNGGQWAVAG